VLPGLVRASQHQPDLFVASSPWHQRLSPLADRINRRYSRCAIDQRPSLFNRGCGKRLFLSYYQPPARTDEPVIGREPDVAQWSNPATFGMPPFSGQ
jgi:hypothetical protein